MAAKDVVNRSGNLKLTSRTFKAGQPMPAKTTLYGENISPELSWSGAPVGAGSFALLCADPDAMRVAGKEWVHWVVVDIPPETTSLPEGATSPPAPARQLRNDFGKEAYGGPRPPARTGVHHYNFTLYALKAKTLGVKSGASLEAIREAIRKEALDQATLTGTFERK
jgi:hypothetical protein